jgi:hypothetical protein
MKYQRFATIYSGHVRSMGLKIKTKQGSEGRQASKDPSLQKRDSVVIKSPTASSHSLPISVMQ